MRFRQLVAAASLVLGTAAAARGDDLPPAVAPPLNEAPSEAAGAGELSVEEIARRAQDAVVVISTAGRSEGREGLGTGFVIEPGYVVTNLHVIGEGRPIEVRTVDGRTHEVVAVHASDQQADLAVLELATRDLPRLELADSDALQTGQSVVVVGNPLGLERSVVAGVVSGRRDVDGRSMIQLAIPVEPGNSGGPVFDRQGRVHGIVTMKSLVTPNLGFAVPANALRPLLERPNPVPLARWVTIGALDPHRWQVLNSARWRQRAGRILVDGAGEGFGGRSLCLAADEPPELPYEVAVSVKLDDESGAAGLAFCADGEDRHYGFYPSNGELRLTRFDGPDVYSWQVLEQMQSEHYRPGEWNTLRVRVESDKLQCFVNERLVAESHDRGPRAGRVGLAQFRGTGAVFRGFRIGPDLSVAPPSAAATAQLELLFRAGGGEPQAGQALIADLASEAPAAVDAIRARADALEAEAAGLRTLARRVHVEQTLGQLAALFAAEPEQADVVHAALLVARLDNEEIDVEAYRQEFDRLAAELQALLPADADEAARLRTLNEYLFATAGFHGSRGDYYNRANSYINEVLDDREGIPLTLAIVYLQLGRRIGLDLGGAGVPGHFMVQYQPAEGPPQFIDVFAGGEVLSQEELQRRHEADAGVALDERFLARVGPLSMIVRMLHNLTGIAQQEKDAPSVLRYLDAILRLDAERSEERWVRAVLRYQAGENDLAREDLDWLLDHAPAGIDLDAVNELRTLVDLPRR